MFITNAPSVRGTPNANRKESLSDTRRKHGSTLQQQLVDCTEALSSKIVVCAFKTANTAPQLQQQLVDCTRSPKFQNWHPTGFNQLQQLTKPRPNAQTLLGCNNLLLLLTTHMHQHLIDCTKATDAQTTTLTTNCADLALQL
jgi:hypothetical protein